MSCELFLAVGSVGVSVVIVGKFLLGFGLRDLRAFVAGFNI